MDTVEVSNMGLIDGSGVFTTQVLGSQPIIYTQDATSNGNDLAVYENKVILMQIVEGDQTSSVVNGYVLNNSQIPVLSQQLFLPQDQFLTQAVENVDESKLITFNSPLTTVLTQDGVGSIKVNITGQSENEINVPKEDESFNEEDSGVLNNSFSQKFCIPCGLYFDSAKLYNRHNRIHLLDKPYKCNLCKESFNYELNLSLHLASHEVTNPYCPICKKNFSRVAGLKAHLILHQKEETMFCPECGDEFPSQMCLDEHVKEHNTEFVSNAPQINKKQFNCLQCQQKFLTSKQLKEHCKSFHKTVLTKKKWKKKRKRSFVCTYCQKAFEKPSQLSRHCRIHTGEKPFRCELCLRAFNQKGSLQIHMLKHTGVKPYECKHCHSTFSQKGNLKAHIYKLHTLSVAEGRVHKCPVCTCIFGNGKSLRSHMTKVHGYLNNKELSVTVAAEKQIKKGKDGIQHSDSSNKENETKEPKEEDEEEEGEEENINLIPDSEGNVEKNESQTKCTLTHSCPHCLKEFTRPSSLMRHIKTHVNDKPYRCKLCFRDFSTSSSLAVHMKSHTGLKCYICDICDKLYATSSDLKEHKKTHMTNDSVNEKDIVTSNHPEDVHQTSNEDLALTDVSVITSENGEIEILPLTITEHNNQQQQKERQLDDSDVEISINPVEIRQINDNRNVVITEKKEVDKHVLVDNEKKIEKPFTCSECNFSFKREIHLKMHSKIHTDKKQLNCSACEIEFGSQQTLKREQRLKHGNLSSKHCKCKECGKHFLLHSSLMRHMETTHKNVYAYICSVCKNEYNSELACQNHMLICNSQKDPKMKPIKIDQSLLRRNSFIDIGNVTLPTVVATTTNGASLDVSNATSANGNNGTVTHAKISDIISSLNRGQHITITQNEDGAFSVTTSVQPPSLSDQSELSLDQTSVFSDKANSPQLFHSLGEVQKNALYDQNFQSLYIQNDNLDLNGTVIDTTNLATILQQSASLHRCEFCSLQFQTLTELNLHKTIHCSNEDNENCICVICQKLFSTNEDFEQHIKDYHKLEKLLCCTICNQSYRTENELSNHFGIHLRENSNANKEKLETLEKNNIIYIPANKDAPKTQLILSNDLNKNENSRNSTNNDNNNNNNTTNNKKRRKLLLTKRTSNSPPSSLLQSILHNDSSKVDNKKEVKKIHHNNKCTYCPKSFRKPSDLVRHLRIHTGERPYGCPKCNKTFNLKSTADCHIKTHSKIRSFKCNICTKTFATSGSLKVHHLLHTGVKPHQCPLCDARFRTSGHKITHLKSHIKRMTQKNLKKTLPSILHIKTILDEETTTGATTENQVTVETAADAIRKHPEIINDNENNDEHDPTTDFLNNINTIQLNSVVKVNRNGNNECLLSEFDHQEKIITTDTSQYIIQAVDDNGIESTLYVTALQETPIGVNTSGDPKFNILQDIDCLDNKKNNNRTVLLTAPLLSDSDQVHVDFNREKYVCTFCKEHFQTQETLKEHQQKVHEDEFYHCLVCPEKFTTKTDLEVHTMVHSLDPEWMCHSCSEIFTDEHQFRCHKCSDGVKSSTLVNSPSFDLNTVTDFFLFPNE